MSPKQSTATNSKRGWFTHVRKAMCLTTAYLSGRTAYLSGTVDSVLLVHYAMGVGHEYKGPDVCPVIFQSFSISIAALWDPNLPPLHGSIYFMTLCLTGVLMMLKLCVNCFISAPLGGITSLFCHSCPLWNVWVFVCTLDKVAQQKSPTVRLFPLDSRAVNHLSTPCGGDILWCWISLQTSLSKAHGFILSQRLWFDFQGNGFVMLKFENIKSNVSPYYVCTVCYATLCLFPLCIYSIPHVSMSSKIGCF